ncbi:MAG: DinB family protein [Chloroflexota bacterium]
MNAHLTASLAVLEELYADLEELVRSLDADCLNWTPPIPETNSMSALVTHTAGSVDSWLSRALGEPLKRDREAEFRVTRTADELVATIERSRAETRQRFARLEQSDLAMLRHVRRMSTNREEDVSLAWCIEHALIHAGEHWGQIQLNRQFYAASGEGRA